MTNRTWIGGGNNQASNPKDWSPTGAPQPGDTLTMSQGTIKISGNAMAGDVLNVSPRDQFTSAPTIHLNGNLTMTVNVFASDLHTFGGNIQFIGSNSISDDSNVVFNSNLIGTATLDMHGNNDAGSSVEVNGFVGSGLTVSFDTGSPVTSMQIDHPKEFFGQLDLPPAPGLGHVAFMGLHVTSADLHNDILSMFNHNRLVDSVRVVGGNNLELQQNSTGVVLTEGFTGSGTIIPLHIG
jgi:hypothetical protein